MLKMTSLISITIFFLFLMPNLASAAEVHQKLEVTIMPSSVGNYTKLFRKRLWRGAAAASGQRKSLCGQASALGLFVDEQDQPVDAQPASRLISK